MPEAESAPQLPQITKDDDILTSSPCSLFTLHQAPMLARTALRAATKPAALSLSIRAASTFSARDAEAMNPHGIEISKAQRIAKEGCVSGTPQARMGCLQAEPLTDHQRSSNRQHALDQA
jgi:cysteine synthase A